MIFTPKTLWDTIFPDPHRYIPSEKGTPCSTLPRAQAPSTRVHLQQVPSAPNLAPCCSTLRHGHPQPSTPHSTLQCMATHSPAAPCNARPPAAQHPPQHPAMHGHP